MFIDGFNNLALPTIQLVRDSYNSTTEYANDFAKSFFETLRTAVSSTRSLRISTVVVLAWTISFGLPLAEAVNLSDKCCGPGFFSNVLTSTCRAFRNHFNISQSSVIRNALVKPIVYQFNCDNCLLSTGEPVTYNGGIQNMTWSQGAEGNGTARFNFYTNMSIPTVHIKTNCRLESPIVVVEEASKKFIIELTEC